MEVKLEIISFQKSLMGDGQSCSFDETGGSIGRSRDNAWVLPDPNRYVSSQHAQITFVDGRFRIIDISTNGVFVNGASTALGRDRHHELADGDRLVLGDYEIAVRLQSRRDRPASASAGSTSLAGLDRTPPKDILDVVGGRRSEPRLGRLELPADAFEREIAAPATVPPSRPAPVPPPERARAPLPPSPPRPTARPRSDHPDPGDSPPAAAQRRPAAPSPAIPDDLDLTAREPVDPVPPPTREAAPSPPSRPPLLPDDLDDLLPAAPAAAAARPASEAPTPAATIPSRSATLPDDLDDLLPAPPIATPIAPPVTARPAAPPAPDLPEGVPLLRPMPGTGNREEPLSPASLTEGRDAADPPPGLPPGLPPTASAANSGSGDTAPLFTALAEGLGVDRSVIDGLDPLTTAATAGRAVRAAANGVAEAIDARNALARAAGVDPRSLDQDDGNPFSTFRSGDDAMRHALVGTPGIRSLDAATRSSVAALAVNANAAAAGLDAVLARFSTDDPPPRSAAEVREIFGSAFMNAYHRETDRLK